MRLRVDPRNRAQPGALRRTGLLLIVGIVVAGCGAEHAEHGLRFPGGSDAPALGAVQDMKFEVPPPPFQEEDIFPCTECHDNDDLEVNRERRVLEMMHDDIALEHDAVNRWCLDCHDALNRDMLRLANGALVPFTESYRLCGQCHGDKYRDWRAGVHGRRVGYWNGPKQYLLCVHCHDSHAPRFKPLEPMPAPVHPEAIR